MAPQLSFLLFVRSRSFSYIPLLTIIIVLHPYYKLDYINFKWGGREEQEEEQSKGNQDAKNWQEEAREVIENTVHHAVC